MFLCLAVCLSVSVLVRFCVCIFNSVCVCLSVMVGVSAFLSFCDSMSVSLCMQLEQSTVGGGGVTVCL